MEGERPSTKYIEISLNRLKRGEGEDWRASNLTAHILWNFPNDGSNHLIFQPDFSVFPSKWYKSTHLSPGRSSA